MRLPISRKPTVANHLLLFLLILAIHGALLALGLWVGAHLS